jgi:hypothetical protein
MSRGPGTHRWTKEEMAKLYQWMKEREAAMRAYGVKRKAAELGVGERCLVAAMYRLRNGI